jgi:hypothetical protein
LGSTTALVALTFSDDSSGRIGCSDSMKAIDRQGIQYDSMNVRTPLEGVQFRHKIARPQDS